MTETIIITVENGCITGAYGTNPETAVRVIDYDALEWHDDPDAVREGHAMLEAMVNSAIVQELEVE